MLLHSKNLLAPQRHIVGSGDTALFATRLYTPSLSMFAGLTPRPARARVGRAVAKHRRIIARLRTQDPDFGP